MTALYIVMTASASTKSSWKWQHPRRRVAVVRCAPGLIPKQIHPRHKAVEAIVRTWECLYDGDTSRCQYQRALAEAHALAEELNDVLMRAARDAHETLGQEV